MRYADAAYRERATRAEPWLGRAAAHVAKGELPGAWAALAQASGLLPGDPRIARLRAEIAMRRGETRSLEAALGDLRTTAPTLTQAVLDENRLRAAHGMPLLPDREAERLVSGDAP
jgi:uncharacterized protein HemY